jgi:hypothetical protein
MSDLKKNMRTRELQGVAKNLAAMSCSEARMGADFELLASLPDGEILFDLIAGIATHSMVGVIKPVATQALVAWLREAEPPQLDVAQVCLHVDTTNPLTNRATLISFHLCSVVMSAVGTRTYIGHANNHLWHDRNSRTPTLSN